MLLAGAADDASAGGPLSFAGDAAAADGSPSWLAAHPHARRRLRRARGDGRRARVPAHGRGIASRRSASRSRQARPPCHVAVAPDGGSLIASCWGDGRVVRMSLDAAGRPSAPVIAPRRDRPVRSGCPARRPTLVGRHRPRRRRRARCAPPRAPSSRTSCPPTTTIGRRGRRRGAADPGSASPRLARAPGRLPAGRAHRDHRHGARPRAVLARDGCRTPAAAGGRAAARQRSAPHGLAPERSPVRRRRASRARSSRSPPTSPGAWRIVGGHSARGGHAARRHRRRARGIPRRRVPLRRRARQQHDRDGAGARRGRDARTGRARRMPAWTGRATTSSCATRCWSRGSAPTRSPRSRSTCAPACPAACGIAPRRRRRPACCRRS